MLSFKSKRPVLPKYVINYILFQMVGVTFLCVMLVLNLFEYKFEWLRLSLLTFTFVAIVLYEIGINVWFYHRLKREDSNTVDQLDTDEKLLDETTDLTTTVKKSYHEKYLWFLFMLLIDIFIIIYLLASYTPSNVFVSLVIGIVLYYIVSVFVRPYFGVNGNEKKEEKKKGKRK